jgi:hypothetical protein
MLIEDRRWRGLPKLRELLANKRLPDSYYGWHSESDNIFESVPRLLETCLIACEFEADLRQSAAAEDRDTIIKELTGLESALRAARGFLDDTVHRLEKVREHCC